MWFGWSSRVLFPDAKTDDSLSNVSFPSGAGYDVAAPARISSWSASGSIRAFPGGKAPREAVIAPANALPSQNPRPNACRMFRTRRKSSHTQLSRNASSYPPSAPRRHGDSPRCKAENAVSAASRPDSTA